MPAHQSATTSDAKARRESHAESLRTALEAIDGVEECIIDDATPGTWESVRLALILPSETGWATPTQRGIRLDDHVNLRSVAQRMRHVIDNDDNVSSSQVVDKPEKLNTRYHDTTMYLVDVWLP